MSDVTNGKTENRGASGNGSIPVPAISLPKGGGAIRGIGEKFAANPANGTGSMTVPIFTSPGRSGFGPQLSLSYDSGSGNGPFGLGWNLSLPQITRKTDRGIPQYYDAEESDVFILSGAEDLVPVLQEAGGNWIREILPDKIIDNEAYSVQRYRPRTEGLFALIERWTRRNGGATHWRSISRDNITTVYGRTRNSRIADPADENRVFTWLICESYDDKGNAILYEYSEEDSRGVDTTALHERNRTDATRRANRYLKRIKYGNRISHLIEPALTQGNWLFEVVFDYDEGHYEQIPFAADPPIAQQHERVRVASTPSANVAWHVRLDPFSSYRAGFEVRTYRRCARVLMFHRFDELGAQPYLVRSTDFEYADFNYQPDQLPAAEDELRHRGSTRFASFLRSIGQSGYTRTAHEPIIEPDRVVMVYLKKSLPPLEFDYSQALISDDIKDIDPGSIENLPAGLDNSTYQWVDLDGEGLSGVLAEQAGNWFYKRNVSALPRKNENGDLIVAARFNAVEQLASLPSPANLSAGQQFLDLAGDGQLDVVDFDRPTAGYFERTSDENWESFVPFASYPNITWQDPNIRFVDLTGDGHADILLTKNEIFTWYPSLAEKGFGSAKSLRQVLEEEEGPRLVFGDGTQSIYLSDMSGDGLNDLVRIRNGEICYWPNLGYGRFGAKVTMDNSPSFDAPEHFDQRRIRLADVDGSGVVDILYLGGQSITIYFNQSGNRWSKPRSITQFPNTDSLTNITTVDLLGNGTACLVWSSPLAAHTRAPMRYIDLMGGQKPHLLIKVANNLGAETRVHYAPSTKFYLADKRNGNPWLTRLPFPVHVVERAETYDWISRNRFVTRYLYHHGYFDGNDREFRGFGMVEQWDTEEFAVMNADPLFPAATNVDEKSHVPPVLKRTWFHTGAYLEGGRISRFFEDEYYREGDPSLGEAGLNAAQLEAMVLPDTTLPDSILRADGSRLAWNLTAAAGREAHRALKGSILRQEIYSPLETGEEADRPYAVSERSYSLELLQPQGPNRHAVLFAHPRETLEFHYERKLYDTPAGKVADPRVAHNVTFAVDAYGNLLKTLAIAYGRRRPDPDPLLTDLDRANQGRTLITYTENLYANPVLQADAYRAPLLCETRTYELVNLVPASNQPVITNLFRFDELTSRVNESRDGHHELPYEDLEANGAVENHPYSRLIEQVRTLFRPDDLGQAQGNPDHLLPLGAVETMALPGETYKLAFTPGLLPAVYERTGNGPPELLIPDPLNLLGNEAGYKRSTDLRAAGWFPNNDPDDHWWTVAGRIYYHPGLQVNDLLANELAEARSHFFSARRFSDPFNNSTIVRHDAYDLLPQETRDPVGNTVTVGERDAAGALTRQGNDYRTLEPALVMDPNRNRSQVAFDSLGMVVATAVSGKPEANPVEGDLLQGIETDLTDANIISHVQDPLIEPHLILGQGTTRLIYDLFVYSRTRNDAEPQPSVVYTLTRETHDADLAGNQTTEIQHSFSYSDGFGREIQKKIQAEPGAVEGVGNNVDPRWVGSGWTIFNNKGKPVRQYEPFFDNTQKFRFGNQVGVSPIIFYDPVERVVGTLHPNQTYEKVVFDPWKQTTWDMHDTVKQSDPRHDEDVGKYFARLLGEGPNVYESWHDQRVGGNLGAAEQSAAAKASLHADTPTVAYFDSLGRAFLTVADNGKDNNNRQQYPTRVELDIEGNERAVLDAKTDAVTAPRGRTVMRYEYDMLGNRIHQESMEAGERWSLTDVTGKIIRTWDSRGHNFRTEFDTLHRPVRSFVRGTNPNQSDPRTLNRDVLFERTDYGEGQANDVVQNLRTRVFRRSDGAGIVTNQQYDFKGNLLRSTRQLSEEYKDILDWSAAVQLGETFSSSTTYDALNRPIQIVAPHSGNRVDVLRPGYNRANLLESLDAWLQSSSEPGGLLDRASADQHFVTNIDYDQKGQRKLIAYGNGVKTTYAYDRLTFRLVHILSERPAADFLEDCPAAPPAEWPGCQIQNLHYTYDAVGNITQIRDDAQQKIYFDNQRVEPGSEYKYDSIYRLIEATGREHLGQTAGVPNAPTPPDAYNLFHTRPNDPRDGYAMGTYTESYLYDAVGNILSMQHRGTNAPHQRWTRIYSYNEGSQLEAGQSNRLSTTNIGAGPETFRYDGPSGVHGNITSMSSLRLMRWDHRDRLQASAQQVVNEGSPETTYYVYDSGGQRVRKITESAAGVGVNPARIKERIYLGNFEIYREYDANSLSLERETLHITDDKQRIALVETKTREGGLLNRIRRVFTAPETLIRYQLNNHLSSAGIELDDHAQIISYEEYFPYGSTSYQMVRSQTEASKRYRYTGKERDEETGFYYHGARYYSASIARWISCDPIDVKVGQRNYSANNGQVSSANLYLFVAANPIKLIDENGRRPRLTSWLLTGGEKWEASPEHIAYVTANMRRSDTYFNSAAGYGALVGVVGVFENTFYLGYDLGRGALYSEFEENSFVDLVTTFQDKGAAAIPQGIASQVERVVQGDAVAFGDLAFTAYTLAEGASNVKLSSNSFNLTIPPSLVPAEILVPATVRVTVPVVAGSGGVLGGGGILLAESLGSGGGEKPKSFPNQQPETLAEELAQAEELGVRPISPGDPGFEKIANAGKIKWAITEDGQLRVIQHTVESTEISHAVLTGGKPVLAAGEADIAVAGGRAIGIEISPQSGHFLYGSDAATNSRIVQLGREAFRRFGIEFPHQ